LRKKEGYSVFGSRGTTTLPGEQVDFILWKREAPKVVFGAGRRTINFNQPGTCNVEREAERIPPISEEAAIRADFEQLTNLNPVGIRGPYLPIDGSF